MADDRADVSEPQPQEKAVDDNQEDGTCRHPKDVNCKTREDLDAVMQEVSNFFVLFFLHQLYDFL